MFRVTPSGFHLDFPNGWTVSVQFGPHNYCSNRNIDHHPYKDNRFLEANTAEIAAWRTAERESTTTTGWFKFEDGQDVKGWQNIDSVMEFMNMVSKLGTKQPVVAKRPYDFDWGIDY